MYTERSSVQYIPQNESLVGFNEPALVARIRVTDRRVDLETNSLTQILHRGQLRVLVVVVRQFCRALVIPRPPHTDVHQYFYSKGFQRQSSPDTAKACRVRNS